MRHAKRQAMAQQAAKTDDEKTAIGRPILRGAVTLVFLGLLGFGGYQSVMHPDTPLPDGWNPTRPLAVSDPVTLLTGWKLNRAVATAESCLATISGFATLQSLPDLENSEQCHIRGRVGLSTVGEAWIPPVETRCDIALRMVMWEQHGLQPAARRILGTRLTGIDHLGSYSCRRMRTSAGTSARMSTHATADAIDITGFQFENGRSLRLIDDWKGRDAEASFLRAARDSACDWFNLTLSPDYNSLHADHFHLQSTGWGSCR